MISSASAEAKFKQPILPHPSEWSSQPYEVQIEKFQLLKEYTRRIRAGLWILRTQVPMCKKYYLDWTARMHRDEHMWGPEDGWLDDLRPDSLYQEFSALHAVWSSTAWEQEKLMVEREGLRRINQLNPRTTSFEFGRRHNEFVGYIRGIVPRPWVVGAGDDPVGVEWDDVVRAKIEKDNTVRHTSRWL